MTRQQSHADRWMAIPDAVHIFVIAVRPAVIDSRKFGRRLCAIGITKIGIMPARFIMHRHINLLLKDSARGIEMASLSGRTAS